MNGLQWSFSLFFISLFAVLIISAFWWNYFHQTKPILDKIFVTKSKSDLSNYARDVYSFFHLLIIGGIIVYAVGLEFLISDWSPTKYFTIKLVILAGIILYFGGLILTILRAAHHINLIKVSYLIIGSIIILLFPISDISALLGILTLFVISLVLVIQKDSTKLITALE